MYRSRHDRCICRSTRRYCLTKEIPMAARRGQKPAGKSQPAKVTGRTMPMAAVPQVPSTLRHASAAGYLQGRKSERIGGRVSPGLLSAAMEKSGLRSQAELLEYA